MDLSRVDARPMWTPALCTACAATVLLLGAIGFITLFATDAPSACAFGRITGVPCATCGATRATIALAGGDVLSALLLNPLITTAWIAGAIWLGVCAITRQRPTTRILDRRWTWVVLGCALAANWVYVIVAGRV